MIVLSLLFTRLFVASAGSVLVVSVAHWSLNAFADRLAMDHLSGSPLVVSGGGLVGVAMMAVAVLVAYLALRRIGKPAGRLGRPVGAGGLH